MPKPNHKPNDKHAKELKRKAKKQPAAKANAGDPWLNFSVSDVQLTCVASGDLELDGQCGISVLRTLPDGRQAFASFLIDGGVVGLKDAWGYAQSSLAEFNETLANLRADGLELKVIMPDAARALIAGGARYADEHGFKLPKDWLRWASVLGGVGDWRKADTAPFRPEYAETIAYARRLVGTTPEAFFARPDITFILPEGEERPADPDGPTPALQGETIHAVPLSDWVEPTREEYVAVYRMLEKRRNAIVAQCRSDMAQLSLTLAEGFEDAAIALRAAAVCVARFGQPPRELIPPSLSDAAMPDVGYFFTRILTEVLERDSLSEQATSVLRAGCHAMSKLA